MQFNTVFNIGDVGYVFEGEGVKEVTVGQVRVIFTGEAKDPPCPGWVSPGASNYGPQEANYEEMYMCYETGIGSGSLMTYGEHIFVCKEDCLAANAKRLATAERRKAERAERAKQNEAMRRAKIRHEYMALMEAERKEAEKGEQS